MTEAVVRVAEVGGGSDPEAEEYWLPIPDDQPFGQGDILRGPPGKGSADPTFGLVITADCDIVQRKAGDRLTYVEVVPMREYLERIWIPDQLRKHVSKQGKVATEGLAGLLRRSGLRFELTERQVLDWIVDRPVEAIDKAVNRTGKPMDAKLAKNLAGLRCALGAGSPTEPLDRWRSLRGMLGEDDDRQRSELATALTTGDGFPEFFVLPELPEADGVGYVALLRFIRTVPAGEVFASAVDARVRDRPAAMYRVGRLKDGIRFSVTQKLAFLFSRIGLPSHYEDACRSASSLAAETLIPGANE